MTTQFQQDVIERFGLTWVRKQEAYITRSEKTSRDIMKHLALEPSNEELQKGHIFCVEWRDEKWTHNRGLEQRAEEVLPHEMPEGIVMCVFVQAKHISTAVVLSRYDYNHLRRWRDNTIYDRDHQDEIIAWKQRKEQYKVERQQEQERLSQERHRLFEEARKKYNGFEVQVERTHIKPEVIDKLVELALSETAHQRESSSDVCTANHL
jgi:hypothetical protein